MVVVNLVVSGFVLYAVRNAAVDIRAHQMTDKVLPILERIKLNRLPRTISSDLDGIQVINPAGQVVSSTANLAGMPQQTAAIPRAGRPYDVARLCGLPAFDGQCKLVVAMRVYQPGGDWIIYAFDSAVPWYVSPEVLIFQICLTVALAGLTWFGVSRVVARTLAPVSRITTRLAEITADGGGMRVPVPERVDDEIAVLAKTANQTLERLETALEQQQSAMEQQQAAMEQQRRFASDASHDLRSPITAMRAQLEEAMLHPEHADWRQLSDGLLASLERLQAIVTDLLTLARLDAGAPLRYDRVDLGELVGTETLRPRSKQVVTTVEPGVVVTGDRLQLVRLLTNLLDNAERHAESRIVVTVCRQGEQAVLEVRDDGPGIAPEQREIVFRRFTRLDAARGRDAGGTGLGLPIAREIATAHNGTLSIEDSDIGARFVLRMPARSE
ncbi:sensor histidine kinase [Nonomuraea sp. SYSU D8015]|uniref:sensor histidine kinase n=1 Tax=Nonomuraea sp. SYSU D8015 TaxID=2593644 RepID=UPI00166119A6|nr:HAMP domain-containing sensor histidine kinase [Nonomuraea sp. SYSU D8015]